MKCPVCRNAELELQDIDTGLSAGVCSKCRGGWVSLQSYQAWLEFGGPGTSNGNGGIKNLTIPRNELARICPRCERILTKYRISVESSLNIDRCTKCSGVWMDAAVWETLRKSNLHVSLDKIFTDHWQKEIKIDDTVATLAGINKEKFGRENFELVRHFKKWVFQQENPEDILTYLTDSSPLQM